MTTLPSTFRSSGFALVTSLATALAAALCLSGAAAQDAGYPSKAVRIIVPAAAGSAADIVARLLGERISKASPHPWVIENRPGAGGTIGADAVAKSVADGHALLFTANNFIIAPSLFPTIPYDIYKDFTPIGLVATGQDGIFVNPDLKVKTLAELIALAKRTPGGINYGAPFYGTSSHLIMEMLKRAAGAEFVFIPTSGGPQSFGEAVAGRVPVVIGSVFIGVGMVKTGRLNTLAIVDRKRSAQLPDVPTLSEAGYPALNLPFWFGLYGPAKLPAAIVQKVNRDMLQVLNSADFAETLNGRGFFANPSTPTELETTMRASQPLFAKVISDAGIKPQ